MVGPFVPFELGPPGRVVDVVELDELLLLLDEELDDEDDEDDDGAVELDDGTVGSLFGADGGVDWAPAVATVAAAKTTSATTAPISGVRRPGARRRTRA